MSNSLGVAVLELSADGSKLDAQLSDAKSLVSQAMKDMSSGFQNFTTSLTTIGSSITRSVTVPVVATLGLLTVAGATAINTYAEFEKQMSGVAAVLGATNEEAQKLKDLAINLGLDPTLIVSTAQAAQVFEELAKNGLTAQQILDGAAKAAIALANATGTDFAVAAEVASTAMQLFNLTGEDMVAVVNNIAGVANMSRFDVEDFALAIAMGGGVAATMKIPIEDFAVAIAGLANSFSSGSDAGTSFKTFLQRLVPDTDPAIEAMQELGIITEEEGNRFFDAAGNMKSLAEIAGVLQEAFKDLSDEQKILALTNIFGTDAMRAASAMAELGAEGFNDLAEAMANTDAAANALTRMDNIAGDIEILSGIIEGFQIKFVDTFKDKLREPIQIFSDFLSINSDKIMQILTGLSDVLGDMATGLANEIQQNGPSILEFFQKLIDALPAFIDKLVEIGVTAAPHLQKLFDAFMSMDSQTIVTILEVIGGLAVLGPILTSIGGALSVLVSLGTMISSLVTFVGGLGSAFAALGAFILSPIGAILLLIATVALLYIAWKDNLGGIRTTVEQLGFIISYYFNQMVSQLTTTLTRLGGIIVIGFTTIKSSVSQIWQAAWDAVVAYFKGRVDLAIGIAKLLVNGIRAAFNINWSELGKKIIDGIVAGIKNGAKAIVEAAKAAAKAALDAAKAALGIKSPSTAFMEIGNFTGMGFVQGLQNSMTPQKVSPVFNRVVGNAAQSMTRNMNNTINVFNPVAEPASNSVDKTLKKLSYLGIIK